MGAGADTRGGVVTPPGAAVPSAPRPTTSRAGSIVVGVAVALALAAVAIAPLLTPAFVGLLQERAGSASLTGLDPATLRTVSNEILADLVLGPPDFDVAEGGTPVLDERERGHMRDVRSVFAGFFGAAATAVGILIVARLRAGDPAAFWRRVRRGAIATIALVVVGGGIGMLAFDVAFELFHRLFFPPGSYLFDPANDRLVQLFPMSFWIEATIVAGALIVLLAAGLAVIASRRATAALVHPRPLPVARRSPAG